MNKEKEPEQDKENSKITAMASVNNNAESTPEEEAGVMSGQKRDANQEDEENKNQTTLSTVDAEEESAKTILPSRPVKRARTAYFIFCDEKRPQIQKEVRSYLHASIAAALFFGMSHTLLFLSVSRGGRFGARTRAWKALVSSVRRGKEGVSKFGRGRARTCGTGHPSLVGCRGCRTNGRACRTIIRLVLGCDLGLSCRTHSKNLQT